MSEDAERFWDERARENALYFVDNNVDYRAPDPGSFWAGGEQALDRIAAVLSLEIRPGDTVVDIGCGVGRMTRALAARARRVIAIDVSEEMLERAREQNQALDNVEWLHGDGRTLRPLADGSADGCFSHVVFQHIPDPTVTLGYVAEMGRVLRPGGWAAFVLSTDPGVHRLPPLARVRSAARAVAGRGPRRQGHAAWLGSAVEPRRLRTAIAAAGLELERLEGEGTQYTAVLCRRPA